MMETHRLPLRDLSNIKFCKQSLLLDKEKNEVPVEMESLPSIKSLINDNIHTTDAFIPSFPVQSQNSSTNPFIINNSSKTDKKELDICHKLKIRLQFAFYKYQTNQIEKKFREIKRTFNSHLVSERKHARAHLQLSLHTPIKKEPKNRISKHKSGRKLKMSNGNYFKTPSRNIHSLPTTYIENISSQGNNLENIFNDNKNKNNNGANESYMNSTISNPHSDDITYQKNTTNDTTIFTTPSSKNKISNNSMPSSTTKKQQTPMSVKAAKSLISLFTSNRS